MSRGWSSTGCATTPDALPPRGRRDPRLRRHLRLHRADRAAREEGQGRRRADARHARRRVHAPCSTRRTTGAPASSSGAATRCCCCSTARATSCARAARPGRCSARSIGSAGSTLGGGTLVAADVGRDRDRDVPLLHDRQRPPGAADRRTGDDRDARRWRRIADAGEIGISPTLAAMLDPGLRRRRQKDGDPARWRRPRSSASARPTSATSSDLDIASCIPVAARAHVLLAQERARAPDDHGRLHRPDGHRPAARGDRARRARPTRSTSGSGRSRRRPSATRCRSTRPTSASRASRRCSPPARRRAPGTTRSGCSATLREIMERAGPRADAGRGEHRQGLHRRLRAAVPPRLPRLRRRDQHRGPRDEQGRGRPDPRRPRSSSTARGRSSRRRRSRRSRPRASPSRSTPRSSGRPIGIEAGATAASSPLVGREAELATLLGVVDDARGGQRLDRRDRGRAGYGQVAAARRAHRAVARTSGSSARAARSTRPRRRTSRSARIDPRRRSASTPTPMPTSCVARLCEHVRRVDAIAGAVDPAARDPARARPAGDAGDRGPRRAVPARSPGRGRAPVPVSEPASGGPTIFVIEDVQFLDEASRDLLQRLSLAAHDVRQVLLVTRQGSGTRLRGGDGRRWRKDSDADHHARTRSVAPRCHDRDHRGADRGRSTPCRTRWRRSPDGPAGIRCSFSSSSRRCGRPVPPSRCRIPSRR